jgi:hypothetical protein
MSFGFVVIGLFYLQVWWFVMNGEWTHMFKDEYAVSQVMDLTILITKLVLKIRHLAAEFLDLSILTRNRFRVESTSPIVGLPLHVNA